MLNGCRNNIRILKRSTKILTRCFNTELSPELQSLQEVCRRFADEELKPIAKDLDKNCKFPTQLIKQLGKLGFMGIPASSEYGGSNMNLLALSVIVEELSKGCASTGAIVSIHNCLYVSLLNRLASPSQKQEFLMDFTNGQKIGAFALSETDAGSDVASMQTTAKKDGDYWILNGSKAWVTSGIEAAAAVIFATIDKSLKHKGITAFIVDLNLPGVQRGRNENKFCIRATSTCSLTLNDVRVHSRNIIGDPMTGFKIAMEQLNTARIGIASQALGIAQASLDTAIKYASQRIAFNKPILKMSSVQNRLAEMALKIEASRLLVRQASTMESTKFTSMAKWHSSETATFCAHNCIQILGGMGIVEELPAERYYRDARITEIYGGITDVQKRIVADQLKREYGF